MLKHFVVVLLVFLSVSALPTFESEQDNDLDYIDELRCKVYNKRCILIAAWTLENIQSQFDQIVTLSNKNDTVGMKVLYFTKHLDTILTILKPYSYNLETIEVLKNLPRLNDEFNPKDEMIKEIERMKNDVSYLADDAKFFDIVLEILNTIKNYIGKIDEEMEKASSVIEDLQVNAVRNKAAVVMYKMYQIENRVAELIETTQYLRDSLVQ